MPQHVNLDELKQRKAKLEFHIQNAESELATMEESLKSLTPEIEKIYGTTDLLVLESKRDQLEKDLEKDLATLETLGVKLN